MKFFDKECPDFNGIQEAWFCVTEFDIRVDFLENFQEPDAGISPTGADIAIRIKNFCIGGVQFVMPLLNCPVDCESMDIINIAESSVFDNFCQTDRIVTNNVCRNI